MLAITIGGGLYAGCIVVNGRQQKRCALSGSRENAALANIFRCLTRQRFFWPKFRALMGGGRGARSRAGGWLLRFGWLMEVTYVCPAKKLCSHLGRGIRRSQLGTPCLLIFKCNEAFAMRTISGLNAAERGVRRVFEKGGSRGTKVPFA